MENEDELLLNRAEEDIDLEAVVDQDAVTSTVELDGALTIRTYSDGAIQRLVHENEEIAADYANSVNQEG